MSALQDIETQAMHLEPADRALLAAHLIASLDTDKDENADELWAKEADARYAAYKRGELKAIPAEEALRKAFENLK